MAPIAPEIDAATSAPVEAITRAVNVEAFMPCSAAETKYASIARTCLGSGSPRQRIIIRSTMVCALSTSDCGTAGAVPRAACATYERTMTDTRASWLRASSSDVSSSGLSPQTGANIATAD